MKIILLILLLAVLAILGTGIYFQSINDARSEFVMGIGVLILALVLIPFFVYVGYKGKDLTRYSFKNMQGPEEKE